MSAFANPRNILITGATGGLGRALALHYAVPGHTLWLHGRDSARLAALANDCTTCGAQAHVLAYDLAREQRVEWCQALTAIDSLDLVIINAGISSSIGTTGEGESWQTIEGILDINQYAAMATIDAVLPAMRARGHGQIALISSLSAWYGLPVTPAYCASKAGIKAYGEAMRGWLAHEGVAVNVVLPGFVDTDMSAGFPGPRPFMWTANKAARRIARGLSRNQGRISFPFPLNLGMWALAVLPAGLSQRILQWLGYGR